MAEQPIDPTPAAPQPEHPESARAATPARKKKHTWLKVLGVVLVLIVLLIVFLPSLASTGPGKSFAVSRINDSLNGTVEIDDWSIGWTSGVNIDGVKVLDQQGVTILTISRVRVPINLIDAVRGKYALGDVLIERPNLVKFVINEDGTTNYGRLVKSDPEAPKKPEDPSTGDLPDLSGKVTITELRGSIYHGDDPAPVMVIQPSEIVVDIPDINGPISNDIRLASGANDAPPGRLTLAGRIDAIENRRIAFDTLTAHQTAELHDLGLTALAPLLKMAGLDEPLRQNGLELTGGRVSLANPVVCAANGKTLTINSDAPLALVVADVTMRKTDAATNVQTTPIDDRTVRVNVAGAFDLGETFAAKLSQLEIVEDRKLFNVATEGGDFVVRIPPGGTVQGSGAIVMTADLVGVNQLLAAFGSPLIEKQPDGSMELQSGRLGARLTLSANEKQTNIDGAVDVNELTLTTAGEPIQNETIQTVLKLTSPADGSAMSGSVNLVSSFVKGAAENLQIQLWKQRSTDSPAAWEMVRNADVSADVGSLSKVYALYGALTPATQPTTPPAEAGLAKGEEPLVISKGSAKVVMKVAREGQQTNLNVSEMRISDLALVKGAGSFKSPRDMVISLVASLDATDVIRQISVTKLTGDLAVATATLTEPLVISNMQTDNATAKGALKVDGQIEEISRLLEALAGQAPGTGYPYAGQLAMTQRVTSAGGPIQLTGKATATDFVAFQQGTQTPAFTEKQLDLTQDLTLDMASKRAVINTLALDMASSGALKANLTGGVTDWAVARKIDDNTRLDLTYDLAKLWPVIKPLISETPEDYKDLIIAGQANRTFVFGGSYPAVDAGGKELPFHEAVKSLTASGGLTVQKLSYQGIDLADLDLPLYLLPGGQLVTVYADRPREKRHPTPATVNGGTIDLGGFTIDLGHEQPRLSIPAKQNLLLGVSMNPIFADNVLGKFLNPSFVDPEEARGLIDVTVGEVTNVPLGDLITRKNDGRAHLIMSIREVNIGNKFINDLLGKLDVDTRDGAILANIRDARITIEDGILTQDLDFMLDSFTLAFDGRVRLSDQRMLPLNMSIPTARLRALGEDLRKYVPETITIPITGTTTAPKWNLDVVVQNLAVEAGKKALLGGARDRALGRDPAPAPPSTTQPAPPRRDDPLGGLLEGILNRARDQEKKPAPPSPSEKEPSGSDRISQPKP